MSSNDDDAGRVYKVETVPPPAGSGDAYSAPTKVGPMTPVLVQEMMHAAKAKAEAKAEAKKLAAASAAATARHPRFAGVPVGAIARPILGPPIPRVDEIAPVEPQPYEEPIFMAPIAASDIESIVSPNAAPVLVAPMAAQAVAPVVVIDQRPEFPLAPPPSASPSFPPSSSAYSSAPPSSGPPSSAPVLVASTMPRALTARRELSFGRIALVAAAATLLTCGLALAMYIAMSRGWHVRFRF
jgi:hypothetical protein